jgi:GTPase KRas protein
MLTDTAGQEEYRGLWATSNLRSDAFLLVYDITSPNSLDALEYYMEMIDMETESRMDDGKTPPVKIVAGNKCDLQGSRVWSGRARGGVGLWRRVRGRWSISRRRLHVSVRVMRARIKLADEMTVLVRRVVETRQLAAGDAPGAAHPYRTAALPAPRANEMMHTLDEKGEAEPRESLWKRLRCW